MVSAEDFSTLVASIYRAALEPKEWTGALCEIAVAAGVSGCVLLRSDRYGNVISDQSFDADDPRTRSYGEYYSTLDPVPARLDRLTSGTVTPRNALVADDVLFHTEFFNDWVRPGGHTDSMFAVLGRDHGSTSWLSATGLPPGGDWSDCATLLEGLAPHLRQAVETQSRITTLERRNEEFAASMDSAADGLVMISRDGTSRANPAAERMLRAGDGLTLGHRAIAAAIHQAICGDLPSGDCLQVRRPSGARPYIVRVVPLTVGRSALMVIADPESDPVPAPAALRRIYGLTRTESEVALRVLNGAGLKPIAEELSMSLSTVRTHLQHVFDKTDTHRQAELVRLLLGGLAATRSPDSQPFG